MEEKIPSFLRASVPPPPLKEVFRYLFMAFGITMMAWLVARFLIYVLIAKNAQWKILMAPPWEGRGFELPFLEAGFWLLAWIKTSICDFLDQFVGQIIDDRFHFLRICFIGPFIEEIEWRGFFWLTRKHSEKMWWKIGFVISAVLFALWHDRGIVLVLVPFAVAISNGLLIAATKRFWPAWLNHSLCNMQIILVERIIR